MNTYTDRVAGTVTPALPSWQAAAQRRNPSDRRFLPSSSRLRQWGQVAQGRNPSHRRFLSSSSFHRRRVPHWQSSGGLKEGRAGQLFPVSARRRCSVVLRCRVCGVWSSPTVQRCPSTSSTQRVVAHRVVGRRRARSGLSQVDGRRACQRGPETCASLAVCGGLRHRSRPCVLPSGCRRRVMMGEVRRADTVAPSMSARSACGKARSVFLQACGGGGGPLLCPTAAEGCARVAARGVALCLRG